MAELRPITKGELQLNIIAMVYNVPVAKVERIYWQVTEQEGGESMATKPEPKKEKQEKGVIVKNGKVEFTKLPAKDKKK